MKHLGDITKINGHEAPIVDCVIGGSPCQDLSVAGLRAGLAGERSGLFMEQVRIVKEMREHDRQIRELRSDRTDEPIRCRWLVWENVPGALSSGHPKGGDFQAVLTEIVRIVEPEAPAVPIPDKGWPNAGCIYDELGAWSVAYRVHDAQHWGTAQRRKRIALVADFGGLGASEVLFIRKGLLRDTPPGGEARQEAAGSSGESLEGASGNLNAGDVQSKSIYGRDGVVGALCSGTTEGMNIQPCVYNGESVTSPQNASAPKPGDPCHTLGTDSRNYLVGNAYCLQGGGETSVNRQGVMEDVSYTLNTVDRHGVFAEEPEITAATLKIRGGVDIDSAGKRAGKGALVQWEKSATLGVSQDQTLFVMATQQGGAEIMEDRCPTITEAAGMSGNNQPVVCLNDQGGGIMGVTEDVSGTLRAQEHGHQPTIIEMTSTKNTVVESGVSPTLTARMGTGGNQVNAVCMDAGWLQATEEAAPALLARQYKDPPMVSYQETVGALMGSGYDKNGTQEAANDMYVTQSWDGSETCGTLTANNAGGEQRMPDKQNFNAVVGRNAVRRLTCTECERLQGFPDGWTDIGEWMDTKGKKHQTTDSARYKALGNSIAVGYANRQSGFWMWLLKRISAQYERSATMASLFDGIGGFPLAWEFYNGKGSAVWASEIEEFPIAVTKRHFPEDDAE